MRKISLLALLIALSLAGTAYAATVVTNVYVINAKGTPLKSGTKAHPRPGGLTLGYTVTTNPAGQRPNVVKSLVISIAGVRVRTNAFPTCSTSRLNNTSQGPSTCPKGSLVGTGYLIAEIGLASSQSGQQLTCRVEASVYNGGGNSLSYYIYENPNQKGSVAECPSSPPVAFPARLRERGTTLVQTVNVPLSVRHPGNNTTFDASTIQSSITFPVKARKIKRKTVGFGETIRCPANHKRHISIKFTLENGKAQRATANLPCK
jgi:hypothetical protein